MLLILVFTLRGLGTCRASPNNLADEQEREGEREKERWGGRFSILNLSFILFLLSLQLWRRTHTRWQTLLSVPAPLPQLPIFFSLFPLAYQIYSLYIFFV